MTCVCVGGGCQAPSATYDAFMRMQTGQETRTIADKINDPNRVSWEQFRKVRVMLVQDMRQCSCKIRRYFYTAVLVYVEGF